MVLWSGGGGSGRLAGTPGGRSAWRRLKLGHPKRRLLGGTRLPHRLVCSAIGSRLFPAMFERGRRCSRGWRSSVSQMNETHVSPSTGGLAATHLMPRGSAGVARSCIASIHRALGRRRCAESSSYHDVSSRRRPGSADAVGPSCTASGVDGYTLVVVLEVGADRLSTRRPADPHGTPPPPARAAS